MEGTCCNKVPPTYRRSAKPCVPLDPPPQPSHSFIMSMGIGIFTKQQSSVLLKPFWVIRSVHTWVSVLSRQVMSIGNSPRLNMC